MDGPKLSFAEGSTVFFCCSSFSSCNIPHNVLKMAVHMLLFPISHKPITQVTHQFSHMHHTYHCWHVVLGACQEGGGCGSREGDISDLKQQGRWVSREDLAKSAVPASVKKVSFFLLCDHIGGVCMVQFYNFENAEQTIALQNTSRKW